MSNQPLQQRRGVAAWLALAAMAAALTLANAAKPPHIDDVTYLIFAKAFADHPARPYDLTLNAGMRPGVGNRVLVPPVLPYYLAAEIALVGDAPTRLKLGMFPIALLLAAPLDRLIRRHRPDLALPLTAFVLFGPAVLPGWNFMLDVPALALALAAVNTMLAALESVSWPRAVLAGLLAGLAMQTKYPWFLLPPLFVAAGVQQRRPAMGVVAATLAGLVFVGWEWYLWATQGETHFLVHLHSRPGTLQRTAQNLKAMVPHLGGLFAAGLPLALLAAGRRRAAALTAAGIVVGLVALAAVPWPPFKNVVLLPQGVAVIAALAWACRTRNWRGPVAFLAAWLLLDVATAAVMSPFPASRRWLGTVVVGTLLLAATAGPIRPRDAWLVALFGALIGLVHAVVDTSDARCQVIAVERAWARTDGRPVWYYSWTDTQDAAERRGGRPFYPDLSVAQPGDWLVVADRPNRPDDALDISGFDLVERVEVADGLPYRTVLCYYSGRAPLEMHRGPRVAVTVYRARVASPARVTGR